MGVIHILKDGSTVTDISGRVVKVEDAGAIYQLFNNINSGRMRSNTQRYRPSEKVRA